MTRLPIAFVVVATAVLLPDHAAAQEVLPTRSGIVTRLDGPAARRLFVTPAPVPRSLAQVFPARRRPVVKHSRKRCMVGKTVIGLVSGFWMSLPIGALIEDSSLQKKTLLIGTAGGTLMGLAIGGATCK